MTVRQAVQDLRAEGLVISEHGRGVFVRPRPHSAARFRSVCAATSRQWQSGVHRRGGEVRLRAAGRQHHRDARATESDCRRTSPLDSRRRGYRSITALPCRRPASRDGNVVHSRSLRPGHQDRADRHRPWRHIRAPRRGRPHACAIHRGSRRANAHPEERRALQLPAGAPVLTVVRTAYDTHDVAVEVCDTVKVASAYLLEYDFSAR